MTNSKKKHYIKIDICNIFVRSKISYMDDSLGQILVFEKHILCLNIFEKELILT